MNTRELINKTLSSNGLDFEYLGEDIVGGVTYYDYNIKTHEKRTYNISFSENDNDVSSIVKTLVYGVGKDGYSQGKEDEIESISKFIRLEKQKELFEAIVA